MKINHEFIQAEKLGEKLAYAMSQGYDVTVEILDRFGNGRIIFEHDDCITSYVDFTEINVNDEVQIENNKLGTIVRTYK